MADLLGTLRDEHRLLRATIESCASATGSELKGLLNRLGEQLTTHLPHKEQLYRAIERASQQRNDPGSATIARIFENNMKVQSAAVGGFFEQLESLARQPEQLERRCRTVLDVIRTRLDTEERAVFSLYTKLTAASQEPRP
jgi:hypothetical protein